ncbi:MAG: hypothetical protein AB7I42_28100 [Bradyrhizobium sp.]|uniref:hypothetical protein n=1 Tax=Bradyrhizobium sp. TaxID=376 RepID=UPI003D102EEB
MDRLADALRQASGLTPSLMFRVVNDVGTRLWGLARAGRTARLDRLVRAEAWIDAVLALIELDLPMWRPCRLIYDGGEWVCSLSRHPEIPFEFDDTVDARHHTQALAILLSFVEAKRHLEEADNLSAPIVPRVASTSTADSFCCNNFR